MCESWNNCLASNLGDKVLESKVMLALMELKKAVINHKTSPAPTHWARFGDCCNQLVAKYIGNMVTLSTSSSPLGTSWHTTPKIHIFLDHLEDYFDLANVTLQKLLMSYVKICINSSPEDLSGICTMLKMCLILITGPGYSLLFYTSTPTVCVSNYFKEIKYCVIFLMKFLVRYHILNWSTQKYHQISSLQRVIHDN